MNNNLFLTFCPYTCPKIQNLIYAYDICVHFLHILIHAFTHHSHSNKIQKIKIIIKYEIQIISENKHIVLHLKITLQKFFFLLKFSADLI